MELQISKLIDSIVNLKTDLFCKRRKKKEKGNKRDLFLQWNFNKDEKAPKILSPKCKDNFKIDSTANLETDSSRKK